MVKSCRLAQTLIFNRFLQLICSFMMFHAVSVSQVDFRDDAEELEADDDGGGPKRAVHGRKVTAFVKAKAVGVGSPMGHVWIMWMTRLPGDSLELNVRYPILFCIMYSHVVIAKSKYANGEWHESPLCESSTLVELESGV